MVYRDSGANQDLGILRVLPDLPGQPSSGVIGLRVERRPEGQIVLEVAPGLPAARAGLAPGDRLLAVDGRGVGNLGGWGLAQALQGQPHSAVRLTFERGASR